MILIAYVFLELLALKEMVRQLSKKSHFRGPLEWQHGKRAEILFQPERQHFWHIYWSLWKEWSWKKCLLVICKIIKLFLNKLNADDKYSVLNRDNLTLLTQMHLSLKQQTFSQFFCAFLKFTLNFEHFQKTITLIADVFLKLRTSKLMVR